jgi:hypothetical protein
VVSVLVVGDAIALVTYNALVRLAPVDCWPTKRVLRAASKGPHRAL